ncbi:hypothetical protein [Actinokineospora sp. NBRC 105648]|uniref:hypothetical protein n=1 Tax=Actinokineospora sp. NBRC 105648 TaxID=3032206 RepID=UPI002553EAB1|nr:hypothetical protein [Actinokineospora sp. NBRC 105648]
MAISGEDPLVTRAEVMERAHSWVVSAVPHSRRARHRNEFGDYRTDCAGYVAMAWRLTEGTEGGPRVEVIAELSSPITKTELAAGDVLLRATGPGHVAIFEDWVDQAGNSFWGLEQRPGLGAVRRRIRYPYENSSRHYQPYRYLNIV